MGERGLTTAELRAQGQRCGCHGSDDYCVCQNVPDRVTLSERGVRPESKVNRIVTEYGKAMVTVGSNDAGAVVVTIHFDRVWDRDSAQPQSYREVHMVVADQQTDPAPGGIVTSEMPTR